MSLGSRMQSRFTEAAATRQRGEEEGPEEGVQSLHHHLSRKACTVQWPTEGQVTSSSRGSPVLKPLSGKSIREASRP